MITGIQEKDQQIAPDVVAICSNGMLWVWNEQLITICGQNVSMAQLRISCGVLDSNRSDNCVISVWESMPELYNGNPLRPILNF